MCIPAHPYGVVDATRTLKTDYGTFHVCDTCAESFEAGGYVQSNQPLESKRPQQRCECEHANHFEPEEQEPPVVDDGVKYCPDCERPNQFGQLCDSCERERQREIEGVQ